MADGLTAAGHVEVPGIFFDTGNSVVKSESDAALKEIAKLLQANPAMKVWVVGHTDAVGSPESNLTLSNARAAAVIGALTQKNGVDAKRLAPFGAGPYAPVASNKSEDGRAKNRRVELVEHP
jgi:outer membrane protein OmpA-like peptidoglycan-associated protein